MLAPSGSIGSTGDGSGHWVLRMLPPLHHGWSSAVQQKPKKIKSCVGEDQVIYAFSLPVQWMSNCLLDLASAAAETFALPGRSCVCRSCISSP